MIDHPLVVALKRYENAVTTIEKTGRRIPAEEVLEILAARAQIDRILKENPQREFWLWLRQGAAKYPPISRRQCLKRVRELDDRLAIQADEINQAVRLEDWHILLPPAEREWLHLFKVPPRWSERYDWLWQGFSIVFLTASFSLLTPLIARFFDGGPDAGVLAVIAPSVVALLASGGALTKTGRQAIEHILSSMDLSKEWWDEAVCAISCLLMVLLIGFWGLLPTFSTVYTWFGDTKQCEIPQAVTTQDNQMLRRKQAQTVDGCKAQLISAVRDYNRAIQLDPDNAEAYYKLGRVYENLGRRRLATGQYEIAVGYSNLKDDYALYGLNALLDSAARNRNSAQAQFWLDECHARFASKPDLYRECRLERVAEAFLQEKKYTDASALLIANRTYDDSFRQYSKDRHYQLLTYLGRAYLEQKAPAAAQKPLERAIALEKERGIAHCLLAQVLEERNRLEPLDDLQSNEFQKKITTEWEQCIAYSSLKDPDEAYWLGIAQQRLATRGEQ